MKNIIFDWSGVVKDAVEAQLWKVNKVFNKFGVESIYMQEFKENFELPYMVFYNRYLPNVTKEQQDVYYKELSFSLECPKSDSCTGVADLIKKLKNQGHYLAIVSSDSPEFLLAEMKEFDLENIFDDMIMEVHHKEEGVLSLIDKRKLDKNITYFIGDSNHEIEVAKSTGIKSIGVTWGFSTEEKLATFSPDYMAHDAKELEDILMA